MDVDDWIAAHPQRKAITDELAELAQDERWRQLVKLQERRRMDLGAALGVPELFLGARQPTYQERLRWAVIQPDSSVQQELDGLESWYIDAKLAVLQKYGWPD